MANHNTQRSRGNTLIKQVGALSAEITADMFTTTTSGDDNVIPFAVPANAIITNVRASVKTAFTGTTPEVKVGSSSDDDALLTTTQFTPTVGVKSGNSNIDTGNAIYPVYVNMTWGASKPTAGRLVLVVEYALYGAQDGGSSLGNVKEAQVPA